MNSFIKVIYICKYLCLILIFNKLIYVTRLLVVFGILQAWYTKARRDRIIRIHYGFIRININNIVIDIIIIMINIVVA